VEPARPPSHHDHLSLSIDREIQAAEPTAIALLRQLIRTPSVSGTEGRHTDPSSIAGTLWQSLAPWPVARVADPVCPGGDNVLAVLRGSGPNVVVLDAHTDTVPPGDPSLWFDGDPYSAVEGTVSYLGHDRVRLEVGGLVVERPIRRRLGRLWDARGFTSAPVIYGRGSFDNKGPVAVAWLATTALARTLDNQGLRLKGTLVCGFTIDEEAAMAGVHALAGGPGCWLDRHGLLPPAIEGAGFREGIWGVALDGSYGFVPVVGHRGIAQLLVRTLGQAAHAATPALGRNAVTMMASVLSSLAADSAGLEHELSSLFADDLLEPASLALGTTIVGGGIEAVTQTGSGRVVDRRGINVVPDWCEATIDCRHPRPADDDATSIQKRIAETIERRALASTGSPRRHSTWRCWGAVRRAPSSTAPKTAGMTPLWVRSFAMGRRLRASPFG
jgi:acetylornithine deacetylase/succinyl-diaminopimelate desuccinylase-like protein